MKKIYKKMTAIALAIIFVIGAEPFSKFCVLEASAANYNAAAAISFAGSHWNTNDSWKCAEFVSRCLGAGGVTIPTGAYYSPSTQSYKNNSGTLGSFVYPFIGSAPLLLYLSEHYPVITNPSSSDIALGDVVFMKNTSGYRDGHVGIVTSISNGKPVYSAHNRQTNSGTFSSSYPCTYVVKMNGSSGPHVHSYSGKYYEAAHPHKTYGQCSCGQTKLDGGSTALASCSTCMAAHPDFPSKTTIKAYTIKTGNTTTYTSVGLAGSAKNTIYDTDLCTINAVYACDWCKVTFPVDSGGTVTRYVKTSVFFESVPKMTIKASKEITVYARSSLSSSAGWIDPGDKIYVLGHTSSAVQVIYPLTSGGYKAGWIPKSAITNTFTFNANGGTGSMSSAKASYQNTYTLPASMFSRVGYKFSSWFMYRKSDGKWYTDHGWQTESSIASNGYKKIAYPSGRTYTLDYSWFMNGTSNDTYVMYANWTPNKLTVNFHANGGSISSDTYKLSSNLVYSTASNTILDQNWTYNNTKTNGLCNASTFGLYRTGFTFAGWGTKTSGGTVFDQNNVNLKPTDMNANIKNGNCSTMLYAQWKENTLTVNYYSNYADSAYADAVNPVSSSKNVIVRTTIIQYTSACPNGMANYVTPTSSTYLGRTGYTATGLWNTKADGTGYSVNQSTGFSSGQAMAKAFGIDLSKGSATVNVYAQWTINTFNVSYNANGGSGAPSAQTKTYGKTLTLSSAQPTRKGYAFKGWNTKSDGSGTFYQPGTAYSGNAVLALYAVWTHDTFKFKQSSELSFDSRNQFIYGSKLLTMDEDDLIAAFENTNVKADLKNDRIATGSVVQLTDDTDSIYDEATVVIFGDVNGDGWYDAQDAFIVNLLSKGLLTEQQIGSAAYFAADCNHDGQVDSADALLLERSGLMLENVDQSKPPQTLAADEAYTEYISVIKQDISNTVSHEEKEEESVSARNVTVRMILNFILSLLQKIFVR